MEIDNNLWKTPFDHDRRQEDWLFMGDADASERSAIICPVIENCRQRGLDPFAYLQEVLTTLPNMTNC